MWKINKFYCDACSIPWLHVCWRLNTLYKKNKKYSLIKKDLRYSKFYQIFCRTSYQTMLYKTLIGCGIES